MILNIYIWYYRIIVELQAEVPLTFSLFIFTSMPISTFSSSPTRLFPFFTASKSRWWSTSSSDLFLLLPVSIPCSVHCTHSALLSYPTGNLSWFPWFSQRGRLVRAICSCYRCWPYWLFQFLVLQIGSGILVRVLGLVCRFSWTVQLVQGWIILQVLVGFLFLLLWIQVENLFLIFTFKKVIVI